MPASRTAHRTTRTEPRLRPAPAVQKGGSSGRRNDREPRSAEPDVTAIYVSDVMTSPVVTVGTTATLFEALLVLRSRGASGLPVVGPAGTVAGVVSERDIARVLMGGAGPPGIRGILDMVMTGLEQQPLESLKDLREKLESTRVEEVMSAPPLVIRPRDPVDLAAEMMREHEINRLPVVDHGRLVGIITRHDLIRAMVRPAPG
jgi:CBS domain-containing protein